MYTETANLPMPPSQGRVHAKSACKVELETASPEYTLHSSRSSTDRHDGRIIVKCVCDTYLETSNPDFEAFYS